MRLPERRSCEASHAIDSRRKPWAQVFFWAVLFLQGSTSSLFAGPEVDLSSRILIDGFSDEFLGDEAVFTINDEFIRDGIPCVPGGNPACPSEEGDVDSQWGFFNDVNQVHITWDANFLYIAVDGITWNNNLMLFFDTTRANGDGTDRGTGLPSMQNVNAWRRNISFANGFEPDLFVATWDGNETPQMWSYLTERTVNQIPSSFFSTAATFSSNAEGRSMEAALPWRVVLQTDSTLVSAAYGDTVPVIPPGFETLRLIACVTSGADGTGSPDSAPDNFSGFQVDSNAPATLDNFAIIPLDLLDSNGLPNPDGIPDLPGAGKSFGISISDRTTFLQRPPIKGVAFSIDDVVITRGVLSPEENWNMEFDIILDPRIAPSGASGRSVSLSAEVYDLRGERLKVLYQNRRFPVADLNDAGLNQWDGRNSRGRVVSGGMYILRVILEPEQSQAQRSFTVIR